MLTLNRRFVMLIMGLEIALLKLHRRVVKHSKISLTLFVLTLVLCCTQLSKARFVLSTEDMAGEGIESVQDLRETRTLFQDGYISTFFLVPPAGHAFFSESETCQLWSWFAQEKLKHPGLQSAFSSFDAMEVKTANDTDLKVDHTLNEDLCLGKKIDDTFEKGFTRLNQSPWPLLKGDAETHPLVFQMTYKPNEYTKYGTFDPMILKAYRARVTSELPALVPDVGIHWAGDADYQWYVLEGLNRSKAINLALVLLLSFLLTVTFRSAKVGLVFISTLILSGLVVYGAKGALNSPFDLLSSSLFIFLGISTLEDFVFVAAAHWNGKSVLTAIRNLVVPSFFTSLTTIIGFVSLGVSPVEMVRKFGLWASFGAGLEWFLVFMIFPAFWARFFGRKRWLPARTSIQKTWVSRMTALRLPKILALISLVAFPLAVFSALHLETQDSPEKIFPAGHEYLADLKAIQAIHGWKGYVYLVFPEHASPDKERSVLQALEGDSFKQDIAAVESFEKGVEFVAKGMSPTNRMIIEREALSSRSSRLFRGDTEFGGTGYRRAIVYLKDYDIQTLLRVQKQVDVLCGATNSNPGVSEQECYLAGNLVAFADFSGKISTTLYSSLFTSLFFVSLLLMLLAIRKGQGKTVHWVLLSAFWGPAVMLIVLWVVKLPVNFSSCIFLSILVGLTGDNAIQYLYSSRRGNLGKGVDQKAWASVTTNVMMAVSSLAFLGAYFAPPRKLGVLLFFGLLISLFGDLWILKAFLKRDYLMKPKSPLAT